MIATKFDLELYYRNLSNVVEIAEKAGWGRTRINREFRSVLSYAIGHWDNVAIEKKAFARMLEMGLTDLKFKAGKQIFNRDHMISPIKLYDWMAANRPTFEEFVAAWPHYGRLAIVLKTDNPNNGSGYGNTYTDADLLWLAERIPSHASGAAPDTKKAQRIYLTASAENPVPN
jgi:hypothetical protein